MTAFERVRDRLGAWFARAGDEPERWVVVDTETSGLDPERDALLAIGAVAVDAEGIRMADSFEVVLRNQAAGDAANVVIHGIGYGAQSAGVPPADALPAFASYVGAAPCVGFHTGFDRAVLERACGAANGRSHDRGVARCRGTGGRAAPGAAQPRQPQPGRLAHALCDRHFVRATPPPATRSATAELLLRLRALAAAQGNRGFAALARMARQHRWLGTS